MKELGFPIIATSGNISEEPICIDEFEALEKLRGIADFYLVHNRKIQRHVDDSIARIAEGREMLLRRARGYAPLPVLIKGLEDSYLAFGPHLKNTIAVNKGSNVFVSQHIGDLENIESINAFKRVACDLQNFYAITPEKSICDLHPEYISTKFAKELHTELDQVQHHYAHVLSCIAENEIEGDVLGVSWDGTGYGTDGTIWGGEFIIPKGRNFERAAYLKPFRLPGGEQAIRDVWRIGFSLLYDIFGAEVFRLANIEFIHRIRQVLYIKQMLDKNINSPVTSSMGRLFDGVSAILGIRNTASFEAQAAMELEFSAVDVNTNDYFNYKVEQVPGGAYVIDWHIILRDLIGEMNKGIHADVLSAKFHNTLAEIIVETAKLSGLEKVVLTGGCFQNKILLEKSIQRLTEENFKVYRHQRVPANDGGISLGQIKYSSFK